MDGRTLFVEFHVLVWRGIITVESSPLQFLALP